MKQSLEIEVQQVSHRYGSIHALQAIDLHIQPGEFVSLVGVSGCGKSTLMQLIAELQTPAQGAIWLDGPAGGAAALAHHAGKRAVGPEN